MISNVRSEMNQKSIIMYGATVLLAVICACCTAPPIHEAPAVSPITITCNPGFEYVSRRGVDPSKLSGDDLLPLRAWLVLDDSQSRYRLRWPTPGISSCSLMSSLRYTFFLVPEHESPGHQYRIVKIIRDDKVVYRSKEKRF